MLVSSTNTQPTRIDLPPMIPASVKDVGTVYTMSEKLSEDFYTKT